MNSAKHGRIDSHCWRSDFVKLWSWPTFNHSAVQKTGKSKTYMHYTHHQSELTGWQNDEWICFWTGKRKVAKWNNSLTQRVYAQTAWKNNNDVPTCLYFLYSYLVVCFFYLLYKNRQIDRQVLLNFGSFIWHGSRLVKRKHMNGWVYCFHFLRHAHFHTG